MLISERMIEMDKYYIPSNSSNPRKTYQLIPEEELFLDALLQKSNQLSGKYELRRMSNGTIDVSYCSCPVGKIKLQGRTKNMMVLKNLYDSKNIEGSLDDFINGIDLWIKYINKYL